MNCFTVFSALCIALFVSPVKLEQKIAPPVCHLLEDSNGAHLLTECAEQNSPALMPAIKECYEQVFNKPGTLIDYLSKYCQNDKVDELEECEEGKGNPPGLTDDDVARIQRETLACWIEKWKSLGGSSIELE